MIVPLDVLVSIIRTPLVSLYKLCKGVRPVSTSDVKGRRERLTGYGTLTQIRYSDTHPYYSVKLRFRPSTPIPKRSRRGGPLDRSSLPEVEKSSGLGT